MSKSDGSWYDKPVFYCQFAEQVFNILILFSWLPQKGHKISKIEEKNSKNLSMLYLGTVDLENFKSQAKCERANPFF